MFGISNWVRTLSNTPPWWASFREALFAEMGDPVTDSVRLRRIGSVLKTASPSVVSGLPASHHRSFL
jgi:hypothetical protein